MENISNKWIKKKTYLQSKLIRWKYATKNPVKMENISAKNRLKAKYCQELSLDEKEKKYSGCISMPFKSISENEKQSIVRSNWKKEVISY